VKFLNLLFNLNMSHMQSKNLKTVLYLALAAIFVVLVLYVLNNMGGTEIGAGH
jgi:Flp pilus assembly protein protease CpaA